MKEQIYPWASKNEELLIPIHRLARSGLVNSTGTSGGQKKTLTVPSLVCRLHSACRHEQPGVTDKGVTTDSDHAKLKNKSHKSLELI